MRLSDESRRRVLRAALRTLTLGDEKACRYVRKLTSACADKRIDGKMAKMALCTYFKKQTYAKALTAQMRVEEARLMSQRTLAAKNELVCHGCMSYTPQLTCAGCQRMAFCMGCAEYGLCFQCDAPRD